MNMQNQENLTQNYNIDHNFRRTNATITPKFTHKFINAFKHKIPKMHYLRIYDEIVWEDFGETDAI